MAHHTTSYFLPPTSCFLLTYLQSEVDGGDEEGARLITADCASTISKQLLRQRVVRVQTAGKVDVSVAVVVGEALSCSVQARHEGEGERVRVRG